jgi:hypothetical protein
MILSRGLALWQWSTMPQRYHRISLGRVALLAVALGGSHPLVARASYDFVCTPTWTLTRATLDACNNLAFLSPGNDSRVNLMLLLADAGDVAIAVGPDVAGQEGGVPFAVETLVPPDAAPSRQAAADATTSLMALAAQIGVEVSDRSGHTRYFAQGDGNRCRTNDDAAGQAFLAALVASHDLPDDERKELARSRIALLRSCEWFEDGKREIVPVNVRSPLGREFAAYLLGAMAFYNGDFVEALARFEALSESSQPWLRDTALYMIGRTQLNASQRSAFDAYGYPSVAAVDAAHLEAADAAFEEYLRVFPVGSYAASAQGLRRRVYWLQQDIPRLSREYAWLLARPDTPLRNVSQVTLVQETASKLLGRVGVEHLDDPQLLAVAYLMQMRGSRSDPSALLQGLAARRDAFAAQPVLYDYLRSAYFFFVAGDADQTLQSLPETLPDTPLDYLSFSQQTLRGLALETKQDWRTAEALWLRLLPLANQPLQRQQLELALALNYERSNRLDAVFESDAPIQRPEIRGILLRHVAAPALLRRQTSNGSVDPTERSLALFTLLYKDLLRGRYGDFLADLALVPKHASEPSASPGWLGEVQQSVSLFEWPGGSTDSGYRCPPLREVARALQKHPTNPVGLNCLGEFVLRNHLDGFPLDQRPPAGELGSTPSQFGGTVYSRLDGYMQVIGDAKAPTNDRAYALYRAINCFASSGRNQCGSQQIDPAERRQWFHTLKRRYPDTLWGRTLRYYW